MAKDAAKLNTKKPAAKAKVAKATSGAKTDTVVAEKQLVRAHARSLRISPRKMRLVTNLVKDMRVNDAVTQLQFVNKKGAQMLQKLLLSAQANAEHNFSLNRDNMFIKTITCDMGPVLKRSFPRARGSAFTIRRKMAHVNVILEERDVKSKKKRPAVVAKAVKPEPKEKILESPSKIEPVEAEVKHVEEPKVHETHHENESDLKKEETSPQNMQK